MIITGDIENILFEDLTSFGIDVYKKDAIPKGKVLKERITIIPKELKTETYWKKDFVEVNLCAPDVNVSGVLMADKTRLTELERFGNQLESVGEYDGTTYRYSVYSIRQEHDPELECHYVNVKLLFEILNVR